MKQQQRSLFVIVGDKGREQVVNLHYMLSKTVVKARPSVLWCYKKELYLSRYLRCVHAAKDVALTSDASMFTTSAYLAWFVNKSLWLQSQEEAYAPDQEDGSAWSAGSRARRSLLLVCGVHRHQILLLPRHPQDSGKHIWHVCPSGISSIPYMLPINILLLLLVHSAACVGASQPSFD